MSEFVWACSGAIACYIVLQIMRRFADQEACWLNFMSESNVQGTQWNHAARHELARLPTPIESSSYGWGSSRLFVKRDDLTDCPMSGNKLRKLEYLVGDARAQNCDTLVTCGGVQSNHARATAIVACRLGFDCVLVLSGDEPNDCDGNLLLAKMSGADVRIHADADGDARAVRMHKVADELREKGKRPYVITSGGSDDIGVLGYVRAAQEIAEGLPRAAPNVSTVVVPVGSGGTYAGLLIGAKLFGLRTRIVGATVDGTPESWLSTLDGYLKRCVERWHFDIQVEDMNVDLISAAGKGYAMSSDAEIKFIARFAKSTGVFLDPVYTGKTLFAFDRSVIEGQIEPDGDVLFVHTGGVFGLFPKRELFNQFIH